MRRLLALLTVAAAVAAATPAHAKPFTYTDAKDMPANAGLDIVGVTYRTEGITTVTKVRGKKVKTYEPTKLLVSMTMAGAPVDQAGIRYRAEAQVAECGSMVFTYAPALTGSVLATSMLTVGCGGAAGATGGDTLFLDPKFAIKGSTMTWTIPIKALPKVARAGALLYQLRSSVDVVEPVLGALGPDDVTNGLLDTAQSDEDWELA